MLFLSTMYKKLDFADPCPWCKTVKIPDLIFKAEAVPGWTTSYFPVHHYTLPTKFCC